MESVQNTREKDLERAETLLQEAKSNVELEVFDESTAKALEEAMGLFEKWKVEEKAAEVYEYWGLYLLDKEDFEVAKDYFQKSLDIITELVDDTDEKIGQLYRWIGNAYLGFFDLVQAEECLNKALVIFISLYGEQHLSVVGCYNILGSVYFYRREMQKSLDYQEKALKIALQVTTEETALIGELYHNIASGSIALGKYGEAKQHLEKGEAIFKRLFPPKHKRFRNAYYHYSVIYKREGNFNKALLFLQRTIDIFEHNQINTFNLAYIHHEMGNIYAELGDHNTEIIEKEKKVLHILAEYDLEIHDLGINANINLSAAYRDSNSLSQSLYHLQKALEIGTKMYGNQKSVVARIYKNLGEYYIENNDLKEALRHLKKALEIFKNCDNSRIVDFASVLSEIGFVYKLSKQFSLSIQAYHKALMYSVGMSQNSDLYDLSALKKIEYPYQVPTRYMFFIGLIKNAASAFFDYFKNHSRKLKDLQASLTIYQFGLKFGDMIRRSYQSNQSKLDIAKNIQRGLNLGIHIAHTFTENTQNPMYVQQIFDYTERGKAYLLLENQQEVNAKKSTHILSHLLQKENDLKSQLVKLEKNIQAQKQKGEQADRALFQQLQDDYFNTYTEFESLQKQLETDYPDYYLQKYSTKTVSISSLQSCLQENQTVLSYFIGEEKIYLFAIASNEYEVFAMEKPDNWADLIQHYLQSIKFHQKEKFQQLSFELYQTLLQEAIDYLIDPFGDEAKQVFIIPHAELHYLPFETLIVSEASEPTTYQSLDYLLNHCQISYHYSATLLHLDLQKQVIQAEPAPTDITFTGFAPVYSTTSNEQKQALEVIQPDYATAVNRSEAVRGDGTWMPLPYSKLEVENISQLFEQQGLNSQAFLHESATKHNLEDQIGKSRFVLIAAHGIVNDEFPELSGLVLAESGGRQTINGRRETVDVERSVEQIAVEDCILNMKEVAMIPMNADLVVLSSCESGIGELHKGEGMMAVNRGFLASGAKNVVSTLFKVNDQASSELTQLLFAHILKSLSRELGRENYAAALQKAKLELLGRKGMSPKAWSGFVLFGAGK